MDYSLDNNYFNILNIETYQKPSSSYLYIVSVHFAEEEADYEFAENSFIGETFYPIDDEATKISERIRHRKLTPYSKSTRGVDEDDGFSSDDEGEEVEGAKTSDKKR